MKKRIITASLLLILAVSMMTSAFAVVAKSKDYYVDDTANVLSDTIKQKIISSNSGPNGLEQKCNGAQIVVVTVQYLDGMYADEYATKLYNDWGVGNANGSKANNGMLLLLATGENKCWLAVGAGISNVFTDSMVNSYFNKYFYTDYDKGQYESAVSNMLEALFSWYGTYYHVGGSSSSGGTVTNGNYNGYPNGGYNGSYYNDYGTSSLFGGAIVWILILLIIIVVFAVAISADRRRFIAYHHFMGMPIPRYYPWFIWVGPHHHWWGPGGPGGFGGPGPGGFGGPRGGGFGGGGRSGRGGGGGFGGFGGGGGGFGGFGGGGGGFGGGGGGFSGGGGGRR